MAEPFKYCRLAFEERMSHGIRPMLYALPRLAGGEYVSKFTQEAWLHYLSGWIAAEGRED